MQVAIAGSRGFIGQALSSHLRRQGHEVVRLVRGEAQSPDHRSWDPERGSIAGPGLADVDAVINLAGAGIADGRWSSARKRELRQSRLRTTQTLTHALAEAPNCRTLLAGSAIGFYGDTGDAELTEQDPSGAGFLADLCRDWEAAASQVSDQVRVVHLRTGHVLAAHGGLVGRQKLIYQLGLGGRIGSGRQWLSWISLRDHVAACAHLLTGHHHGPVNLVAPQPVRQAEFAAELGRTLRRPAWLPLPLPLARAVFTSEMVDDALLASQRVAPTVLAASGFSWADVTLTEALGCLTTPADAPKPI